MAGPLILPWHTPRGTPFDRRCGRIALDPPIGYLPTMGQFAPYEPRRESAKSDAPCSVVVRPAVMTDAAAVAGLIHGRHGGDPAELTLRVQREVDHMERLGRNVLLVAELGAEGHEGVVAYGRVRRFEPEPDAPENTAPPGWYLVGVIVDELWRRRGIAHALTEARLRWIGDRADEAWYFTNPVNRPSIDLHTAFGFREVTRDFHYPRVTFTGGVGVLFRARLNAAGGLGGGVAPA